MARYDHLPIIEKAYDLCFEIEKQVADFSRDYKYMLGMKTRGLAHEIPALIIVANNRLDRIFGRNLG